MDHLEHEAIAQYLDHIDGNHKPWLLAQLRLAKLAAERPHLTPEDYGERLAAIHQDVMALGEWWQGREQEVFEQGQ